MPTDYPAVVCYPPSPGPAWQVKEVRLERSPEENELKIRMLAAGLCHTDIVMSCLPTTASKYPKIVGHEGAGIVEEVGPGVKVASVGDRVLLSYNYCKHCELCKTGKGSYCLNWNALNLKTQDGIFKTNRNESVAGSFFGQSSFSGISIVKETCVVNVTGLVKDNEELKLLAPLGCGVMTGSGAILNAARAQPSDSILVIGLGAVGLSAIMAAKMLRCKEIIAVDRVSSRLEVAKELGASKFLDMSKEGADLARDVQRLVNNQRISYVIETTGITSIIASAMHAMGKRGKLFQIGIPRPGAELTIPLDEFFRDGKVYEANILGDTCGQLMVPKMIQWYREGKFPIDKIVKFIPVQDALEALHGMESGSIIKPVLVW